MENTIKQIEDKMKNRNYCLYATSNNKSILHYGTPFEERPNISCEIHIENNNIITFKFKYLTKKLAILTTNEIGNFFDDEHFNKFESYFWNLARTLYNSEFNL